jgi:hypothetical protein
MDKLHYTNVAEELQLTSAVSDSATVFQVSGQWGNLSVPFTLVIDPDTAKEEIVLVTATNTTSWTVERGFGDHENASGYASDHSIGAVIRHAASAYDFNLIHEMNAGEANVVTKHDQTWGDIAPYSTDNPAPSP